MDEDYEVENSQHCDKCGKMNKMLITWDDCYLCCDCTQLAVTAMKRNEGHLWPAIRN